MSYSNVVATEALFFINQLPYSYAKRIPEELIKSLYKNFSNDIYSKLDINKPFFDQELSEETKEFISYLTNKYLYVN